MTNGIDTEEFVKKELSKSENPVGKLAELETYISTLPGFIPRAVVDDLARLGFVYGYVEASRALMTVYDDMHSTMNEDMSLMCKEYEDKFMEEIRSTMEKLRIQQEE